MYGTKRVRLQRIEASLVVRPRPSWLTARPWTGTLHPCPCIFPPGRVPGAHPRARTSQRPPGGDWRVWGFAGGRGAGKTRAGSGWVQHRVEAGVMKLGCLIAPTMADIRDVLVEGPSGLLGGSCSTVVPAGILAVELPRFLGPMCTSRSA